LVVSTRAIVVLVVDVDEVLEVGLGTVVELVAVDLVVEVEEVEEVEEAEVTLVL